MGGPIATAIGFSNIGPFAGSFATSAQSIIGNVASGSIFANLQSAGAKCLITFKPIPLIASTVFILYYTTPEEIMEEIVSAPNQLGAMIQR